MIKWAWENVGAQGIYFGPNIETEDESSSDNSSTGEEPGPSRRKASYKEWSEELYKLVKIINRGFENLFDDINKKKARLS